VLTPLLGWKSAQILVTLILSVVLFGVFIAIEHYTEFPALPLSMWTSRFTPLFIYQMTIWWYAYAALILCLDLFTVSLVAC
jgi:hypothetical protein